MGSFGMDGLIDFYWLYPITDDFSSGNNKPPIIQYELIGSTDTLIKITWDSVVMSSQIVVMVSIQLP